MKTNMLRSVPARLVRQLRRRGSTLLVVVALMGMLSLLGVMFFAFASQEEENAKNFHEAAKVIYDPDLGPDVYFNWALRQLIIGPSRTDERNSALWGSRMSLLPNAYGNDVHPHSGTGVSISQIAQFNGSGVLTDLSPPGVDLDRNGVFDPFRAANDVNENGVHDFLELNQSPAANVLVINPGNPLQNEARYFSTDMLPEPDVDYTYPDINNVALAYHGWTVAVEDLNGNGILDANEPDLDGDGGLTPARRIRVVKPSFWRPELLQRLETGSFNEDANGDGYFDPATEDTNGNGFHDATDFNLDGSADGIARLDPTWYWADWSTSKVLRPHPNHYYVDRDSNVPPTTRRFLNDYDPVDAGIIAALPGGSKGFPFSGRRDNTIAPATDPQFPIKQGVWTAIGQSAVIHEFDVDADGDNIYEAILMDLSFPPEARPSDGALYVPLYGITVYDADGLINLNAAGNLSGDTAPPNTVPPSGSVPTDYFGNGLNIQGTGPNGSISQSHSGISPFEVNPLWALDAVPAPANPPVGGRVDVLSNPDYAAYFGRTPTSYSDLENRWELANMEFWWLNKGRINVSGAYPDITSGRLGESNRNMEMFIAGGTTIRYNDPLVSPSLVNAFPFAGTWNRDDNRDANEGGVSNLNGGQTLAFQHPISFSGRGRFTRPGNPKALNLVQPLGGGNPNIWLRYTGYDVAAVPGWITYFGGNLMQGTRFGALYKSPGVDNNYGTPDDFYVDDFLEMLLEPLSAQRPADNIFTEADSAIFQLNKSDIDNAGVSSRIDDLMPANINPSDPSIDAFERRRRFATSTWDRRQYGINRPTGAGPDNQPGRAGVDDDGNGIRDDARELGFPGTDDLRAWEFNTDYDDDGLREFPPQFGPINRPVRNSPIPPYKDVPGTNGALGLLYPTPQDPFRPEVRRLLEVEYGNRDQLRLQLRLSINGILEAVRNKATAGHPLQSPLESRPLTPHATDTGVAAVPVITPGNQLPPIPFTAWNGSSEEEVQEFWARYDRQRLARDIYVLLYTLCGGDDTQDMSQVPGTSVYSNAQLREMAQFAVNIVDAMDRDNVMTIFEYDRDLSNGWDLDDQYATVDGTTDRALVVGVEAQQLTFSESLWVFQQQLANDNSYTPFDETNPPTGSGAGTGPDGYHFLQVELRNISPKRVDLAEPNVSTGTGEDSVWRLRWQDTTSAGNISRLTQANHNITNGNGIFFKANGSNVDTINPGSLFTIATSNNTAPNSSDLFVNHDADPDFELIAPAGGTATPTVSNAPTNVTPNADLDLVNTGQVARYHLANGSAGDFVSKDYDASAGTAYLILERRANPKLPGLSAAENPWVVVDYTQLSRREFITQDTTAATQAETTTALRNIESRHRQEPLNALNEQDFPTNAATIQANSLMSNNQYSPPLSPFATIQAHFDRDFTSTVELLNVPIRGPRSLTRAASRMRQNMDTQLSDTNGPHSAFARILRPIHPTDPSQNNHWHRLLGFVEVPSRVHRQLGNNVDSIVRIPGRINLNTIRHPEVMAALIDNPELFTPTERDIDGNGAATAGLEDYNGNGNLDHGLPGRAANDATHDWWLDHLRSRDGVDLTTGLSLPGMPKVVASGTNVQISGARPFRDLSHTADATGVPGIGGNTPNPESPIEDTIFRSHPDNNSTRGLFDVGTAADANSSSASNRLEGFVQRQILSKIAGNTTTRSNVFYVFVSVHFHEAYRDPVTNAVRVGGRIDLNEDGIWDDGHRGFFVIDRSKAEEAYNPRTKKFDWEPLVKHRLTIN